MSQAVRNQLRCFLLEDVTPERMTVQVLPEVGATAFEVPCVPDTDWKLDQATIPKLNKPFAFSG